MKKILFFTAIALIMYSCTSNCQEKQYSNFRNKFIQRELPINIPGGCSNRSANDSSNITKEEASLFLKIDEKNWKHNNDYYYNTGCSFIISELLDGIIYFRAFLPFDFSKQVSESVLVIFNNEGQLVDSLSVQGNIGDNLTYKGYITKNLNIIVKYEELLLDEYGSTKIIKRKEKYHIGKNGRIQQIE